MAVPAGAEVSASSAPDPRRTPLLGGKLEPPRLGFAALPRPRLEDLLSRAVEATPVTLLSGPAGAGKTVLAASWLRARGDEDPPAWLSLDDADDDPATFWSYVVAALNHAGLELPASAFPASADAATLLGADLMRLPRPVVLILDGADCLTRQDLTGALDLLVRYAGTHLRLVLCARADPLLPLHRYRLAGTLTEIRAERLAFTAGETGALFAALGHPLPAEAAAALWTATEGWAAGLRLAAVSLASGTTLEQVISGLAAHDGSAAKYLAAEVLQRQPAAVQRLLLQISVTDRLEPAMVDQLSKQPAAPRMLAALDQANAFVERMDAAPGAFRIHPLVREVLQAQLAHTRPDEFAELHRTCAGWCARAGDVAAALRHARAAGEGELAARLLIDDLAVGRELTHRVDESAAALPAGTAGPDAAVLRAATSLARGCAAEPGDLAAAAASVADAGARSELRASAAVVCSAAVAEQVPRPPGDAVPTAAGSAAALVAALPEERPGRAELAAVAAVTRATALLHTDAADDALLTALQTTLAADRTGAAPRLRIRCLAQMALLEALRGRLRTATQLAAQSEALADVLRLPENQRSPAAATAAAWVAAEQAEYGEQRRWTERARQRTVSPDVALTRPLLAVLTSRQRRFRGERGAAEEALRPACEGSPPPRWIRTPVTLELARLHIADRRGLDQLPLDGLDAGHAEMLRAVAAAFGPPGTAAIPPTSAGADLPPALAVPLSIARACLHVTAGDARAAITAAERALRQAEPEGLRGPFLDAPPQLRPLLRGHPRLADLSTWLTPTASAVPTPRRAAGNGHAHTPGRGAAEPLIRPELSAREQQVLQHVAELKSTAEIAAALFLTENTVRTHVRNILNKMAATRRGEAVRRARELQLLRPTD